MVRTTEKIGLKRRRVQKLKQTNLVRKNSVFSPGLVNVTDKKSEMKMKALKASVSSGLKVEIDMEPSTQYVLPQTHSLDGKTAKFGISDYEWMDKLKECPVFHPTKEEFLDPLDYVKKISPQASKFGICKVVSPLIPSTPASAVLMNEKNGGFKFTTNIQPLRLSAWNINDKASFYTVGRNYTIRAFEDMANKAMAGRYYSSGCLPSMHIERDFWDEMMVRKEGTVEYGINLDGSAFPCSPDDPFSASKWNLKTLPNLPQSALRQLKTEIPGVSGPMLYIGMLFSIFAWHVEDHYLYSINYHHCGAPKTWYGVPGHAALQFEKVVQENIYNPEILAAKGKDGTSKLLMEKTTMFPPSILLSHDVPVYKAVQMPGEFVITFPRAYHAGFSHGFNCGEAANFAMSDWFLLGAAANTRYARLKAMPVLPYEEVVCKEAMFLFKSSNYGLTSPADSVSLRQLKTSFACLLRWHHLAFWYLKTSNKSMDILPKSGEAPFCILCKRECYLGHIVCKCHRKAICLFHEDKIRKCKCGPNSRLYVREDIVEMESAAKVFEEDEEIFREVELQMQRDPYPWMQCNADHEYISYCELQLLFGPTTEGQDGYSTGKVEVDEHKSPKRLRRKSKNFPLDIWNRMESGRKK